MADTSLQEQLAYIVASVNRQLEEELEGRLRPAGLPIEKFRILKALSERGACGMKELASLALLEPPTLTKIIDRMVNDTLVLRLPDPSDRRRVLIKLAPAGEALVRRLKNVARAQERRLEKALTAGKAEELRTLLRSLMAR